jgi:glycosyltransferase involved in cell wall biosynthesis
VLYVPIGGGAEAPVTAEVRAAARNELGVAEDAPLFGVFGALTAEKRVPQVLAAFRIARLHDPRARLLLAGHAAPTLGLHDLAAELGLDEAVIWRPSLDDAAFDRAIAAADIVVNLRWPSAMETSGPWVRALAAGRPTIVVDLPAQAHLPALDPRTWQPWQAADRRAPIMIAIDIRDEDHSLRRAMARLTDDRGLGDALGRAARTYWEAEHAAPRVLDAYDAALAIGAAAPPPHVSPEAGAAAPGALTASLLAPFGPLPCELF